jgi:hypothetical protein
MKPSWDEQRRDQPRTDRKFRDGRDEHLLAEEKEELAKSHQGDKLAPDYKQQPGEADDRDRDERATAP